MSPFYGAEPFRFVIWGQFMYTRYQQTTGLFAWQQLSGALQQNYEQLAFQISKRPPEPGGLGIPEYKAGLFGRLLPRRVERAGIVDLGHLVIGEAEHLAQDLVGVLAEQRRTRHLARC